NLTTRETITIRNHSIGANFINSLSFSHDDSLLSIVSEFHNPVLLVCKVNEKCQFEEMKCEKFKSYINLSQVVFSADKEKIAVGTTGGCIYYSEIKNWNLTEIYFDTHEEFNVIAFDLENRFIFAVSETSNLIYCYDIKMKSRQNPFQLLTRNASIRGLICLKN